MSNNYDSRRQDRSDHKWQDRLAKGAKWFGKGVLFIAALWGGGKAKDKFFNHDNRNQKG